MCLPAIALALTGQVDVLECWSVEVLKKKRNYIFANRTPFDSKGSYAQLQHLSKSTGLPH